MSDIKRMHDAIEKLTSCMEKELENGVQNVDTEEMGKVVDIIKDLAEAEYYRTITVAMDESEYGEDYDYEGRKGYRGQPRDSRGRYISRRGRRMGYEEPMMMYDEDWEEMERMRDLDRMSYNRMGYSGSGSGGNSSGNSSSGMNGGSNSGNTGGNMGGGSSYTGGRGYSESNTSRSENARRGYEEAKSMNDNSPEGKKKAMESLENYMKELSEEMTQWIGKMDASEKSLMKNKMSALMQRIQ